MFPKIQVFVVLFIFLALGGTANGQGCLSISDTCYEGPSGAGEINDPFSGQYSYLGDFRDSLMFGGGCTSYGDPGPPSCPSPELARCISSCDFGYRMGVSLCQSVPGKQPRALCWQKIAEEYASCLANCRR